MSYKELKEQLGVDPDLSVHLFTPVPKEKKTIKNKLLSFLSDSCYLTPASSHSHSTLSDSSMSDSQTLDLSTSLRSHIDSDSQASVSFSPSELDAISSPFSPSECTSKTVAMNSNASGFPQPLFCEDDEISFPNRSFEAPIPKPLISSDMMDTEDTLFAQPSTAQVSPQELLANSSLSARCFNTSQASEETPTEWANTRPNVSQAHLLASVSNSLKTTSVMEPRPALKSVANVPSPSIADAMERPVKKRTRCAGFPRVKQ